MDRESASIQRITVNLPRELLADVRDLTGKGITDSLVQALTHFKRTRAFQKAQTLKGKLKIKLNIGEARERHRR